VKKEPMTSNFESGTPITREPKARVARRDLSTLLGLGAKKTAATARALPKSASVSGSSAPGLDGLTREAYANAREQLVLRDARLHGPEPGAFTTARPRVSAPGMRATSARLRPYAVRSVANPVSGRGVIAVAA
jgi:hypothetical protein